MNSLEKRIKKLEDGPTGDSALENAIWFCDHFGLSREWVYKYGPPKGLADFYELFRSSGDNAIEAQMEKEVANNG